MRRETAGKQQAVPARPRACLLVAVCLAAACLVATSWKLSAVGGKPVVDHHEASLVQAEGDMWANVRERLGNDTAPYDATEPPPSSSESEHPEGDPSDGVETKFERYKSAHMDDDSPYVPFAFLNACHPNSSIFFAVENDPSCMADVLVTKKHSYRVPDGFNYMRFWETKEKRRTLLRSILSRLDVNRSGEAEKKSLLLMTFNIGFAHQFGNWYCGLAAHGVDVADLQRRSLILATDQDAIDFARSLGFVTPTLEEIRSLFKWGKQRIARSAASSFGLGSHAAINMYFKFAMPTDLVSLGYSVLLQDVDVIWTANAMDIILGEYCPLGTCDAIFIHEARAFISPQQYEQTGGWARPIHLVPGMHNNSVKGYPEANTGMFVLRPTTPVKSLLKTLLEAIRLQQWRQRDQIVWNSILLHKAFANLTFNFLPKRRFVPGKYLSQKQLSEHGLAAKPELVALHASDTSNYGAKIRRLRNIGFWFFDESSHEPLCQNAVRRCRNIQRCWEPLNGINSTTTDNIAVSPIGRKTGT